MAFLERKPDQNKAQRGSLAGETNSMVIPGLENWTGIDWSKVPPSTDWERALASGGGSGSGSIDMVAAAEFMKNMPTEAEIFTTATKMYEMINQIKADEIEAGALENILEMAKAPDANSDRNKQSLGSESSILDQEAKELQDEQAAETVAAAERSIQIARLTTVHKAASTKVALLRSGT